MSIVRERLQVPTPELPLFDCYVFLERLSGPIQYGRAHKIETINNDEAFTTTTTTTTTT